MANSLINGPEAALPPPVPASSEATVPTWGYDAKTGEGKLFELAPGGKLPAGYVDSPDKVKAAPAKDKT